MSVFIMIKTGSVFVFVHVIISCFTIVGSISCTVQPGPHPLWGLGEKWEKWERMDYSCSL